MVQIVSLFPFPSFHNADLIKVCALFVNHIARLSHRADLVARTIRHRLAVAILEDSRRQSPYPGHISLAYNLAFAQLPALTVFYNYQLLHCR